MLLNMPAALPTIPAELIAAETTVDDVRYVLLTNDVLHVIDADSGCGIAAYRYPTNARAVAAFAELVGKAEAAAAL
jgi:hypothetical protein